MTRTLLILSILVLLAACGPASVPTSQQPLPTPKANTVNTAPGDWTSIRLTQSGGFMGRLRWVEVRSSRIVTYTDERASKTINGELSVTDTGELVDLIAAFSYVPPTEPLAVCADCFVYTIEFVSPSGNVTFEVDDIYLAGSGMEPLISFLGGLLDSAFR